MKKGVSLLIVAVVLMMAVSCTTVLPFAATSNPVGKKTGEAKATLLFNVIPLPGSDAGIQTAAKQGGISKISTVDARVYWWFIGTTLTTVVTGD
jgi:hypothetical protein